MSWKKDCCVTCSSVCVNCQRDQDGKAMGSRVSEPQIDKHCPAFGKSMFGRSSCMAKLKGSIHVSRLWHSRIGRLARSPAIRLTATA